MEQGDERDTERENCDLVKVIQPEKQRTNLNSSKAPNDKSANFNSHNNNYNVSTHPYLVKEDSQLRPNFKTRTLFRFIKQDHL